MSTDKVWCLAILAVMLIGIGVLLVKIIKLDREIDKQLEYAIRLLESIK